MPCDKSENILHKEVIQKFERWLSTKDEGCETLKPQLTIILSRYMDTKEKINSLKENLTDLTHIEQLEAIDKNIKVILLFYEQVMMHLVEPEIK